MRRDEEKKDKKNEDMSLEENKFVWWVLWHINLYRLFNAKSIFM